MTNRAEQPPRKRGRGADPAATRAALLRAASESLAEEGFAGTTARAIAHRAGCNQAAIYYHFADIDDLLIKALAASSEDRLDRYRERIDDVVALEPLIVTLQELYAEDRASGHLTMLAELVGGITARPALRPGIADATQPWLDYVERQIGRVASNLALGAAVPAADLADAIFSLVVGLELRNKIDGRTDRADRLFALARLSAALFSAVPPTDAPE